MLSNSNQVKPGISRSTDLLNVLVEALVKVGASLMLLGDEYPEFHSRRHIGAGRITTITPAVTPEAPPVRQ